MIFKCRANSPQAQWKLAFKCNKLGMRVTLRVAEQCKTEDLRKLANIRKFSVWVETLNLVNSSQKINKSRHQSFSVMSNFTGFIYFVPRILSRIVWRNKFLIITCHNLLQTLIEISSNSIGLKIQIEWFYVSTIFYTWFALKFNFVKTWTFLLIVFW